MAKHSRGVIVALSSDIALRLLVTFISVVPMTALISSGLSRNPFSALSTTGGGAFEVVVDLVADAFGP